MTAPHTLSLAEAAALIAARRLSPVELLADCLARIEAVEPRLNAFIRLLAGEAMEQARAAEAEIARNGPRGPLHGIPVGLKDIIDLAGHPTTCHSKLQLDRVATEDAAVVQRLREAGAVFPGKLATHEFAIGGPCFDLPFPPARNPWNPAHHPGGSSSGSGAAVAARMLPAALGTDTGGSVRHPASHCGLVGLKPTYGLVSRRGVFPLAFTLDHVGPMTRTVRDNALLLGAMAGPDPLDPGSAMRGPEDYTRDLHKGLKGLRIGFVRHFHETDTPASPEVAAALEEAARLLAAEGAEVRSITLPPLADFAAVNRIIQIDPDTGGTTELFARPPSETHVTQPARDGSRDTADGRDLDTRADDHHTRAHDEHQPPRSDGRTEDAIGSDNRYKLSGHGDYFAENKTFRVPEGTSLTVYAEHGSQISNSLGNLIESGGDTSRVFKKTYYPGEEMPNYTLFPPADLTLSGTPRTVDRPTTLSELLKPNMGAVDFAACLGYWDHRVFDVHGIYHRDTKEFLHKYPWPEVDDDDNDW